MCGPSRWAPRERRRVRAIWAVRWAFLREGDARVLGRARRMFRTRNGHGLWRREAVAFEWLGEHFKPEVTAVNG